MAACEPNADDRAELLRITASDPQFVVIETAHPFKNAGAAREEIVKLSIPGSSCMYVEWDKRCSAGSANVTFWWDEACTVRVEDTAEKYFDEPSYSYPKCWQVPFILPGCTFYLKIIASNTEACEDIWGISFTAVRRDDLVKTFEVVSTVTQVPFLMQLLSASLPIPTCCDKHDNAYDLCFHEGYLSPQGNTFNPSPESRCWKTMHFFALLEQSSGKVLSPFATRSLYTGETEDEYDSFSDWPRVVGTRRVISTYSNGYLGHGDEAIEIITAVGNSVAISLSSPVAEQCDSFVITKRR
jgi:hypothetical protein